MPLPIIAVALIATGSATGGGGIVLGGKGAYDIKKAKDRVRDAATEYDRHRGVTETRAARTNEKILRYGAQQEESLIAVVVRMADFLREHERQVRESERLLVDGVDVQQQRIPGLTRLDADTASWIRGAIGSAVAGSGTAAGVAAAAGAFGTASTGAAISGLSGAAAQSATLAYLGGGALAQGGGGIALGTTALNFVTIGPALLVGGLVVKSQGTKALTQATEIETKLAVAVAELDRVETLLEATNGRLKELGSVLQTLTKRGVEALDVLESEPFDPVTHASRFQKAMALAMSVREVAAAPVVNADGEVDDHTADLVMKYRHMTEESE
ncbi:hypothetical protein GCM10027055_26350 [Janibacter alkaliphilus]|uniref:Uncharacterized protein n=1 Tax=Janibacter alkaliphilus TaxID=1069963 RepID=A0A852XHG1_9MICO|nr:hypothetical protein [Janibacter alkaliphilus]NYG37975.1 hypothetical protein [Janibacter alkaliphilus]